MGELEQPHRLVNHETDTFWLWFEAETNGESYSTQYNEMPTRINLYRRGPYFDEIHWFDFQLVSSADGLLPLKGDLALYCYPEKILASVTWHATENIGPLLLAIKGKSEKSIQINKMAKGQNRHFRLGCLEKSCR